jgi:hypothetical protein
MAAPIITPTNKSAGFQAADLFSTIFSVTGSVTSYNVALAGPNDGTVTGGPAVMPGVITANVTPAQFNAMSFVGALNAGTDTLYLQAVGPGGHQRLGRGDAYRYRRDCRESHERAVHPIVVPQPIVHRLRRHHQLQRLPRQPERRHGDRR